MAPPATYTLTSPPTPALTPPAGVIPNFEQPYTLLPYTIVTISEAIIVTTILVLARIYVKVFVVKKLLLEDYTCILGWLAYLVFVSLELHSASYYGAGTHMWNLSQETVSRNQHLANIADMHVCIAYGCIKVSLFLLISRIFLGVKRNILFWINQLFLWANAIYYTIALFINIFACRPRRKIWNADVPGKCFNTKMLYESAASFNTIGDVVSRFRMISPPLTHFNQLDIRCPLLCLMFRFKLLGRVEAT
ncbi:MAG: hypothetical protein Q9191_001626 [Dirinaria sp. TL-2023a]